MPRLVLSSLALFAALTIPAHPASAQCLEGNCVNGTGIKLTRGHKYSGEFKNNHRHGFGLYEYPNGDKFEGTFIEGVIQGEGVYYFVNGDRYEGEFKNDKRHGVGTYYPVEGRITKGVWENNVLVTPEQMVESSELDDMQLDTDTPLDAIGADEAVETEAETPPSEQELDSMVDDILTQE